MIEMDILEKTDLDEARYYDVNEHQLWVLHHIAKWYYGNSFVESGRKYSIGRTKEPELEKLFDGYELVDWSSEYERAHEALLEEELLKEGYICRRKIDWIPTEEGIQAIRELFKQSGVRPTWGKGRGPWGDPNESLLHRKGVVIAAGALSIVPPLERTILYPNPDPSKVSPDVIAETDEYHVDEQATVLTDIQAVWARTWRELSKLNRTTMWLFADRETMCVFFNRLDEIGEIDLHGKRFTQPYKNWSAKAVNRKIWQSQNRVSDNMRSQTAQTITGLFSQGYRHMWEWRSEILE